MKNLLFSQSSLQSFIDSKLRNLWDGSRIKNNIDLEPINTSFNLIQLIQQFLYTVPYSFLNDNNSNIEFNIYCDESISPEIITDENWLQDSLRLILNNNIIIDPYCDRIKINISLLYISNSEKQLNKQNDNHLINSFKLNSRVEPSESKIAMISFETITDNSITIPSNDNDEMDTSIILEKPGEHNIDNNKSNIMEKRIEILGGYCNYKVGKSNNKRVISFAIPYNFNKEMDYLQDDNNIVIEDEKSFTTSTSKNLLESSNNTGIVRPYDEKKEFLFPIDEIPVINTIPKFLSANNFKDVKHIKDGNRSIIFHTKYNNKDSAIKMLMVKRESSLITISDFDIEINILMRISHPNVVQIYGAGTIPRIFFVMEWLSGGTLADLINSNKMKNKHNNELGFNTENNTNDNLCIKNNSILVPFEKDMFSIAVTIAKTMQFLHYECFDGLTIIFRDLKPDNIGFTEDGTLKLFDFGLITCIRRNQNLNDCYELSGASGSIQYTAPEIALNQKYNEKVDVYSFGVLLYEMLSNEHYFNDYGELSVFIERVIMNGERPLIPRYWPIRLQHLISECWDNNPIQRPSFNVIVNKMELIKREIESYDSSNLLFNFLDMC